jgi:glucan 1,3-beta-glucosidase
MAPREPSRSANRQRRGETSRKNQHRKKKSQSSRRPLTASDDSRDDTASHALSADALAQLNRHHAKSKNKPPTRPERTKKVGRNEYRELRRQAEREHEEQRPRRKADGAKKRRVVSGAIMEEGRVRRSGLRGGGQWSEDSYEKDFYDSRKPKKKSKKKFCMCHFRAAVDPSHG